MARNVRSSRLLSGSTGSVCCSVLAVRAINGGGWILEELIDGVNTVLSGTTFLAKGMKKGKKEGRKEGKKKEYGPRCHNPIG